MRGKDLFERAFYLNEEIDENSFEDGCKWGALYREYIVTKKQKKPSFNEAYNDALSQFDETAEIKQQETGFKFKSPSSRRLVSYRVKTAHSLLDALEDKFDFHPYTMKSDDIHRLNRQTADFKQFAKSFINDVHVPSSDRLLDGILAKDNSIQIITYLYNMMY